MPDKTMQQYLENTRVEPFPGFKHSGPICARLVSPVLLEIQNTDTFPGVSEDGPTFWAASPRAQPQEIQNSVLPTFCQGIWLRDDKNRIQTKIYTLPIDFSGVTSLSPEMNQ